MVDALFPRRIPPLSVLDVRHLNTVLRHIDYNFAHVPDDCASNPRRIPALRHGTLAETNTILRWIDRNFWQMPGAGSSETTGGWPRRIPTIAEFTLQRVNTVLRWIDWNFQHMSCPPIASPCSCAIVVNDQNMPFFPWLTLTWGNAAQNNVIDRTSDGTLWLLQYEVLQSDPTASAILALFYSADNGDTWARATSGADPSQGSADDGRKLAIYIDEQDYMHAVWTVGAHTEYSRGIQSGNGWSWSTPQTIGPGGPVFLETIEMVAFAIGSDVYIHWVEGVRTVTAGGVAYGVFRVQNIAGTPSISIYQSVVTTPSTYGSEPHLAFDHAPDSPKTPTATPHVYIGIRRSPIILDDYFGYGRQLAWFARCGYSAGPAWNTAQVQSPVACGYFGGTPTIVTNNTHAFVCGIGRPTTTNTDRVFLARRNLGNTTTSYFLSPELDTWPLLSAFACMDLYGDIHVIAISNVFINEDYTGCGIPYWSVFTPSLGSWRPWEPLPTMGCGIVDRMVCQIMPPGIRHRYGAGGLVMERYTPYITPVYAAKSCGPAGKADMTGPICAGRVPEILPT